MAAVEPDIFRVANQFRTDLLDRDRMASIRMVRQYAPAHAAISRQIDTLADKMADAQAAGKPIKPVWLFQQERLAILEREIANEVRQFAYTAGLGIEDLQRLGVDLAGEHSRRLTAAGLGEAPAGVVMPWTRLEREATADLVGFTENGSPLRDLLDELGPDASQRVRDTLIQGVATGLNPRKVARLAKDALGGNLARALTIARTEMLRSYREATLRNYQANRDIIKGWVWHSARNRRTCPVCWAMHGTEHSLDERLDGHPNCRCAMVPITKTWKELGFRNVPESRREVPRGADLFRKLDERDQRFILGRRKYEAYRAGHIELDDLVRRRRNKRWGTMRVEASLTDALERAGKRTAPKAPRKPRTAPQAAPRIKGKGPQGTPVSDAFSHIVAGKNGKAYRETIAAIDRIHGDGQLPKIPIHSRASKHSWGTYYHRGEIGMKPSGPYPRLTLAHEIGHFIDHHGVGAGGWFTRGTGINGLPMDVQAAAREWVAAVENSQAYRKLVAMRDGPEWHDIRDERGLIQQTFRPNKEYLRYTTDPVEAWARSYSQYIAVKSQDAGLLADLATSRRINGEYTVQWDEADFRPIEAAIDKLFIALGWLT